MTIDGLSSLPFELADIVVERIGPGENATAERTTIVEVADSLCKTESGRWYDRHTGARSPRNSIGYRAIHGTRYSGAKL